MTWSYRLISQTYYHGSKETPIVSYSLHEVYYDKEGAIVGWTKEPITFDGDTVEEVREALATALLDALRHPPLKMEDLPA